MVDDVLTNIALILNDNWFSLHFFSHVCKDFSSRKAIFKTYLSMTAL